MVWSPNTRARLGEHFTGYASVAWTDGTYESYETGPCPLELIGSSTTVCDLSGKPFTGTPRWAGKTPIWVGIGANGESIKKRSQLPAAAVRTMRRSDEDADTLPWPEDIDLPGP